MAFIFGRAGSTDPLQLGAFALAPFLLAFLAPVAVRWSGARPTMLAAGYVLILARAVTQLAGGGDVQLWATTVGALAGLVFLAAAAAGGLARAALAVGLAGGLALDVLLELVFVGGSADWAVLPATNQPVVEALAWVVIAALLGTFAYALPRALPAEMVLSTRAWPWLLLGPVLALHLIVGGLQPPLVAATAGRVVGGAGDRLLGAGLALLIAGTYALAVRYAFEARPRRDRACWPPVLLLVGALGAVALQGEPAVTVASVLLITALGVAAATIPTTAGTSTPARHATAAAGGTFVLFLVAFPYYASYDLPLGVWNGAFLVLAAVGLAVGLLVAGRRGSRVAVPAAPGPRPTLAGVAGAGLLAAIVVGVQVTPPQAPGGPGFPVTVALANLHMGFDVDGRYVGVPQGVALSAPTPDVVVLNEVDRGWALNGGQDVLHDVNQHLDLPYVFAPAADDVWGNAILSRYPIVETGQEILPDSGGYMIRSAVWVVLDVGSGRELAVVGTHLHHRGDDAAIRGPQATRVAEIAAGLSEGGRPVIVAGDLNAAPDAPELAALDNRFRHAAGATVPLTYPAWGPDEAIDHVYLSPDLEARSYDAYPIPELSDHAWVLVTVAPAG